MLVKELPSVGGKAVSTSEKLFDKITTAIKDIRGNGYSIVTVRENIAVGGVEVLGRKLNPKLCLTRRFPFVQVRPWLYVLQFIPVHGGDR